MSRQHNSNDGRNCWRTSRERERLKARFDINQRVSTLDEAPTSPSPALHEEPAPHEIEQIRVFLRQIEAGAVSAFSLSKLSKYISLLDKAIPTRLLSHYKIKSLCTSRFGKEYTDRILEFFAARETCTLLEYVSLLGEYKILGSLMIGGVDPTKSGWAASKSKHCDERRRSISVRVLQRFFDAFPLSLKAFIVKRVIDMRVEAFFAFADNPLEECTLCHTNNAIFLSFGPPCRHRYCETCFWNDLLENVDDRAEGCVVLCPSCGESSNCQLAPSKRHRGQAEMGSTPLERRRISIAMYECLPVNTRELKSLPKKKNYKKDALSSTWQDGVARSLGSSKDVRRDKFFSFVDRNAYHFVRGCLEEGFDTDQVNEYSQTGLYLASWRGHTKLVKLLLDYGADVGITAHGGSTAMHAATWNGHHTIVAMLREASFAGSGQATSVYTALQLTRGVPSAHPVAITLIDPNREHPGAGSWIIDDSVTPNEIDWLIGLWQAIPFDLNDHKQKKSIEKCSDRHYFCDAQGSIQRVLSSAISQAGINEAALVFPHMRFLHYAHSGSILAPHVDLCRIDSQTGIRSTHTFILYLYDCQLGGETALLQDLAGETCLAVVEPRRGRLLLFPHSCPHEGKQVVDVPKILLRGEVYIQ
jgi:hypothetical protein